MSYSSDADVLFVHDPLPGADEQDASEAAFAVANELRRLLTLPGPGSRRSLSTPTCDPRAARARWSGPWRRTPPTTSAGRRSGRRRRCCVRRRSRGTRTWGTVHRVGRPAALPADGLTPTEVAEVRRIKARVDCRAPAARRRSGDPPQARSGRARRHRVDGPAAADAVRRQAQRHSGPPALSRRCRPPWPLAADRQDATQLAALGSSAEQDP